MYLVWVLPPCCIHCVHLPPFACIFLFFSPLAPSAPPQEVECTSLSSTAIRVSWVAPPLSSRNGVLTRYSLAYQAVVGEDTSRHIVDSIPADVSSWEMKDLEKWTEYKVWVRAHTDVGAGPESPMVIVRTDEDGKWLGGVSPLCTVGKLHYPSHLLLISLNFPGFAAPSTPRAPQRSPRAPQRSPCPDLLSCPSALSLAHCLMSPQNMPSIPKPSYLGIPWHTWCLKHGSPPISIDFAGSVGHRLASMPET